jgi:catechol 2,3-dioxygenase-like lactoylglutathione lyase family enzyme
MLDAIRVPHEHGRNLGLFAPQRVNARGNFADVRKFSSMNQSSASEPKTNSEEIKMAEQPIPATFGVDHVGLSVRDLESTRRFFCDCLGWRVVGERPDYPAAFVSDGHDMVTLWQVEVPDRAVAFDRRANVGLHHLALAVADRAGLDALYERVAKWPGVVVEFAPELSGKGPKIHFIVREPSGVRIEFAFDPRLENTRKQH